LPLQKTQRFGGDSLLPCLIEITLEGLVTDNRHLLEPSFPWRPAVKKNNRECIKILIPDPSRSSIDSERPSERVPTAHLDAAVRHGLSGHHPGVAPGVEGPLQPVECEEEHAREHEHQAVLLAQVPEQEEQEQHVQVVHGEEEFEPAASDVTKAG
jgi:hypothetical protein